MEDKDRDYEESVYSKVEGCYQKSYNDLTPLFKKFNDYENLYWFHTPVSKRSAKSNLFDPLAYELVEHNVAHLFAQLPTGYFTAEEPNDVPQQPIIDALIKYQTNRPNANLRQSLTSMGRSQSIFGTAFGMLGWKYERKQKQMLDENGKAKSQWVTTYDDPYFKYLNIYDCYPDTEATNGGDMRYFIHDEFMTIGELEANNAISQGNKRYINLDKLKEAAKANMKPTRSTYSTNASLRQKKQNDGQQVDNERILVRRYYSHDKWYSIAPDYKIVIEDRANPYWHGDLPIHTLINIDYPNLLYGIGEIAPVMSLMLAQNQTLNMRMDNIKMILEPSFKAKNSALKYKDTWKMGRNRIMVVDNENDIQLNVIPDVTSNTFQASTNYIMDAVNRRTGRTDFLNRTDTAGNRTASEIKAMAGEQNARLRYKSNNIDDFIKRLMNQWLQLNQQFLTKTKVIKVMGVDAQKINPEVEMQDQNDLFFKVSPDAIQGSFDFQVDSGSTKAAELNNETQNLTNAIQMLERYAPILQQSEGVTVNFKPVLETVLKNLGVKALDKIFQQNLDNGQQQVEQQFEQQADPAVGGEFDPASAMGGSQEVSEQPY